MTAATSDLRYPIGKFSFPDRPLTEAELEQSIAAIEGLPDRLEAAVAGLTDEQFDTPYREGGWTVRQVVHHVADSHMNSFIRYRLALTEDEPVIKPYEEQLWAELADAKLPADVSLSLIRALHTRWSAMLRSMTRDQFSRTFRHPAIGVLTLNTTTALYAWHSQHHVAHITSLRQRMGW